MWTSLSDLKYKITRGTVLFRENKNLHIDAVKTDKNMQLEFSNLGL